MKKKWKDAAFREKLMSALNKNKINDGLPSWKRCRLRNLEEHRRKKREYAKTPEQKKKRQEYQKKWWDKNREKCNEKAKIYRKKHGKVDSKTRRNAHLKHHYGITIDQFNEMLAKQNNRCDICGKLSGTEKRNFHVDHCHKTGKVRGILCNYCNPNLGWYERMLPKIVKYLEKHGELNAPS